MAWTVAHVLAGGTRSGSTVTLAISTTTTGNTLIVATFAKAAVTVTGITVSTGAATFSAVKTQANGTIPCEIWAAANITGGTTPTVTVTFSANPGTTGKIAVWEGAGGPSVLSTDGSSAATGTATAVTSGALTTTINGDLVLGAANLAGTLSSAAGGSWTNDGGTGNAYLAQHQTQASAGSITSTGTQGTSVGYTGVIAAFSVFATQSVSPSGIASTRAFGTAVVTPGAVGITPSGIAPTNAFGTAVVGFPSSTFDVGPTSPGANFGNIAGIVASKITLTQSGTLQSISIYLRGIDNFVLGLYADSSGTPAALLASSASASHNSAPFVWDTQSITSGPTLSPGDYWLAFQNQSNIDGYYDTTGSGAFNNSVTWTGTLGDPFPTGSTGAYTFTIYATFTAVTSGQSITPSGIASTAAFGTAVVAPGAVGITPTGIASTAAFGTVTLLATVAITPSGIASTAAFGTAVVAPGAVAISPTGIASTVAFGTVTIGKGAVNIAPSGIASTTAFGTPTIASTAAIAPAGIASTIAFGTAVVAPGAANIAPSGIASTTAFGTVTVAQGGAPQSISPSGIASTTAFGTASLTPGPVSIAPSGIASTVAFGTAVVSLASGPQNIAATGIASTNAFGTAAVVAGTVNIAPSGIASTNAFGTPIIVSVSLIAPSGIASTNAFGTPTIASGAANIAPSGIASTIAFGTPTIQQPSLQGISAGGIGSTTAFGTAKIIAIPREQPVPPYAGEDQPTEIDVPAWIRYREEQWEDGPWVMPPYAWIFPSPAPVLVLERGYDSVHHEWLKTHKRPPGPRRLGDANHRPQSVLATLKPTPPIKPKASLCQSSHPMPVRISPPGLRFLHKPHPTKMAQK